SDNKVERDDDSKKSHPALETGYDTRRRELGALPLPVRERVGVKGTPRQIRAARALPGWRNPALARPLAALLSDRQATIGAGPIRPASGTTIAACVLSIRALTSACSAAGTENLSSVVCRSSMKASHSASVIARCRCDASISRPV